MPTKDNIADDPSREVYKLLEELGAIQVDAKLDSEFEDAQAWSSLSLVGVLK